MSWAEEHYGWADEEDFKQTTSKRRRNMTTQAITVAAVTKEPKVWNDETCWGVKVGNGWMDLYVKDRPSKGQTYNVEIEEVQSKGRTYLHARPVKGSQPAAAPAKVTQGAQTVAQARTSNNSGVHTQTFDTYAEVARKAHTLALELEPRQGAERARVALVSTFLIEFGYGHIALEAADEWGTTAPSQPIKHEKTAAHIHLEKVIWDYCERTGKTGADALAMFKEVSGKEDMPELSEKEAIQARLKAEAIIDPLTDYKALFTEAAKAQAKREGWELAGKDAASIKKKQALLFKSGVTKAFRDLTNLEAKAAWEILTDDVSH